MEITLPNARKAETSQMKIVLISLFSSKFEAHTLSQELESVSSKL
jgi:hypothetical protein